MGLEAISININSWCEKELSKFTLYFFCRLLSPIDAMDILKQIDADKKTKVVNMHPQGFKQLFETIESSKEHSCNWLYDDFMEYVIT